MVSEPPFKLRISRELLDKIENLQRVGYKDLLAEFKTTYEQAKTLHDENTTILNTLGKLWAGKYGKVQGAKAFDSFERFEPILKEIPRYRDHMIHPFQVFLMGTIILDENYDFFGEMHKKRFSESQIDSVEFAWLLFSTFHDICYPLQKYEEFSKNFFLNFLESSESPVLFQTEKLLLDNFNLKYVDQLVALYEYYSNGGNTWKYDSECKIDASLRSSMIGELTNKSHALLSALALVKKTLAEDFVKSNLENYLLGRFSSDIYPAALAIALQDEQMLNKIIRCIQLEEMPLCFLLIYCDLVQECGRSEGEDIVELRSFNCGKGFAVSKLKLCKELLLRLF